MSIMSRLKAIVTSSRSVAWTLASLSLALTSGAATGEATLTPQQLAQQALLLARAQVTQGIELTRDTKAAVSEYFGLHGKWPGSMSAVRGGGPTSGPMVSSVSVSNGAIIILFANGAAPGVDGRQLVQRPTTLPYKTVVWSCGYAQPKGTEPESGEAARPSTTIEARFLPENCQ